MSTRAGLRLASLVALLGVVSCGSDNTTSLLNLDASTDGPDAFSIVPGKPLQTPTSYAALPPPTPGGRNLTDPTPKADAIVALGGRPGAGTVPTSTAMSYVTRFGVDSNIRQTLAREDAEWRQRNNGRLLERLMNVNVYFDAYEKMSLDQYRELERWRAAGRDTPAAPPDPSRE
ncbi:DUF3035 domain-containing protein [Falsihalocynthiibacter sp. SS001]|uniref:DUF3035 domain-containing protein n=1 Tax=Falsihalocynthiibacter sp. SS001 TaxID=3349698 RepID=UPI0036D40CD1